MTARDKMQECPNCEGYGHIEVDDPRPHAGGFNCGYIDTVWVECERCHGSGEILAVKDNGDEA